MQAISKPFSWAHDFMLAQSHDKMACTTPHPKPVVNIPILSTFKRKRTDSRSTSSPVDDAPSKKQKPDPSRQSSANPEGPPQSQATKADTQDVVQSVAGSDPPPIVHPVASETSRPNEDDAKSHPATKFTPAQRDRIVKTVQRQLDLEILYKNNELRFIEQEIAKCQIAMEQLRRCQVIPFPGQPGSKITPEQIGIGTGPALEPPTGLSRPDHPAAWGVTDGPYTRHYARWLIPDSAFDPAPAQPPRQHMGRQSIGGRSMRGTVPDSTGATSRGQRASTGSKLQALSSNYPVPKDRNAPLIATRPSDGKSVRLVCKFCGKDNISSMQGFLNHCRIQHKFEYTSHGQAAEDCGILLEDGEVTPVAAPIIELPTPISATTPSSSRPLVHPLIFAQGQERRKPSISRTPGKANSVHFSLPNHPASSAPAPLTLNTNLPASLGNTASASLTALPTSHTSFVPSPLAPRLSSLLQKRGVDLNLKTLVESAKDRSDFENICDQLPSDDEQEEARPSKPRVIAKPKSRRGTAQAGPRPPGLQLQGRQSLSNVQKETQSVISPAPLLIGGHTPGFGGYVLSPGILPTPTLPKPFSSSHARFPAPPVSPHSFATEYGSPPPATCEHRSSISQSNNTANASPHTVDTNPGLVTDDDGDSDDEEEDAASVAASNGGVDVGVFRHDEPDVKVRGQGHDEDQHHREQQPSGVAKTEAEILRLGQGGEQGFRGLGGSPAASRRARPGKGGKGKGGKKRG